MNYWQFIVMVFSDLYSDNQINVLDVQLIVNILLGDI